MRIAIGLLILAAHLSSISGAQADAEPKPVLTLIEYGGWSGIGYPWPDGLQLVAYDNGLIIKQAATGVDQYGNVRFISERKQPADTAALAARVKAALNGVATNREARGLPTDQGWTIVQYWDAEKSALVEVSSYGMPCVGLADTDQDPFLAEFRANAGQKFVALCDELLRLELSSAVDWFPETIMVMLHAEAARPDQTLDWPSDWPTRWQEDHEYRKLCVPLANRPSDLTVQLLTGKIIGQSVSVQETAVAWWVVKRADISMPGTIRFADHPERVLLDGPCATDASP